jgi:phospholipase/carboxylesterase
VQWYRLSLKGVPNLSGKNIFIGAGQYDPIVPHKQTETLFGFFEKAGANVVLNFQENSGHELGYDEISAVKDWYPTYLKIRHN